MTTESQDWSPKSGTQFSQMERLSEALRNLAHLSEEFVEGETLAPCEGGTVEGTAAEEEEANEEKEERKEEKVAGVTVVVTEGTQQVMIKYPFRRQHTNDDSPTTKAETLAKICCMFLNQMKDLILVYTDEGKVAGVTEVANESADFFIAVCVLILIRIDQVLDTEQSSAKLQMFFKTAEVCFDYLLTIFKNKLISNAKSTISQGKAEEKSKSEISSLPSSDLMRSDLMLILFEMATGEASLETVPAVPDAWEDLFPTSSQNENEQCNLTKSLKSSEDVEMLTEEMNRTLKQRLKDILRQRPYSPSCGSKSDRKVPTSLQDFFVSVLRSQKVPTELIQKCIDLDDNHSSTAKNDDSEEMKNATSELFKLKTGIVSQKYIKVAQKIDFEAVADKRDAYVRRNVDYFVRNNFLGCILDVCASRNTVTKMKLKFDVLTPSIGKGVLENLQFENCKVMTSNDLFYLISDELKYVNSALVFASKMKLLTFSQGEQILKLMIEYLSACLVIILSLAISTTAIPKRESVRADDENFSIIQEMVPFLDKIVKSASQLFTGNLSYLSPRFDIMASWLMVSFLHGLSKSQYSVSMDRQNSSRTTTSKRSFSRSYSFRAGTSTGVMTNAILTIVKHTFEILPRVIECAPVYTEGDQSNAVGYHLYIEALFVKINLTSIMFWLLKVLFKRAVALTPLPAQTTTEKDVTPVTESNSDQKQQPITTINAAAATDSNKTGSTDVFSDSTIVPVQASSAAPAGNSGFDSMVAMTSASEFALSVAGNALATGDQGGGGVANGSNWVAPESALAPLITDSSGPSQPAQSNAYRNAVVGDNSEETEDNNSSTTGEEEGNNSLFGEDMMVIDEDEDEEEEEEEEDQEEDEDDDDDDEEEEEDYEETGPPGHPHALQEEEDMEWTEEDEEEPDEFGDHDDVTEDSQTVVVDDLSIYEMQQHLEHGDLNVMLPPVVAVVPEVHTAQGESLPSENDVPSGLEAAGSQNQLGGNGVPPPPPPPLADDLSDFLNALGNDDDNEEAVLGLLFQDDEMVTAKADEANNKADDPKCVVYLDACLRIVELILQNGFGDESNLLSANMKSFVGQQQCAVVALIVKELSAPSFELSTKMESLKLTVIELAQFMLTADFCTSSESRRIFFRELGLDWNSSKENLWPLSIPTSCLSLLTLVFYQKDECLSDASLSIWLKTIDSLIYKIENSKTSTKSSKTDLQCDDLSPVQFQFLQLIFYRLTVLQKSKVASHLTEALSKCHEIEPSGEVSVLITRIVLMLELVVNHYDAPPSKLSQQVNNNLFRSLDGSSFTQLPDVCLSSFVDIGLLSSWKSKSDSEEKSKESFCLRDIQTLFYDLGGRSQDTSRNYQLKKEVLVPRASKEGLKCLIDACKEAEKGYDKFYDSLIKLFRYPEISSSDSFVTNLSYNYASHILIRFISILPPSPNFVAKLLEPVMSLADSENPMHLILDVMWSGRIQNECFKDYIKELLAKIEGKDRDKAETSENTNAAFTKMTNILQAYYQKMNQAVINDGNRYFVPLDQDLLIIDTIASRFVTAIQVSCKEEHFDPTDVEEALPVAAKLLDNFTQICRNYIIEKVQKSLKPDEKEHLFKFLNTLLQFDFASSEFQSVAQINELKEDSTYVENVDSNGQLKLGEVLNEWQSRSKDMELFPDFESWQETEPYKSQPIGSELFASHVMMAHLRSVISEGYAKRTIGCLQHTFFTLSKLVCLLSKLASSQFLERQMNDYLTQNFVNMLTENVCFCRDVILPALEECSEKVFKKPLARAQPIQDATVRRVFQNCYDAMFLVPLANSQILGSDTLFQGFLLSVQRFLLLSNPAVKKEVAQLLSRPESGLKEVIALSAKSEMSVKKLKYMLKFLLILMQEVSSRKEENALRSVHEKCQFGFDDLKPILKVVIPEPKEGSNLLTIFTSNEVFTHVAAIAKSLASNKDKFATSSLAEKSLDYLMSLVPEMLEKKDYCINFDKIMTIMLILASYELGAGHVRLFKTCIGTLPRLAGLISGDSHDCESIDSSSKLIPFNSIVGYICEVMQLLKSEAMIELDNEDYSKFVRKSGNGATSFELDSQDATLTADVQLAELAEGEQAQASGGVPGSGAKSQGDGTAHKLCTFTVTQKEFMNQHWYHCYSCSMHDSVGVCSVCAKLCHKGHDVTYAKFGSFYCDCGAKGETHCKSLTSASIDNLLAEQKLVTSFKRENSGQVQSSGEKGTASLQIKGTKMNIEAEISKAFKVTKDEDSGFPVSTFAETYKNEMLKLITESKITSIIEMLLAVRSKIETHVEETSPVNASKRLIKSFEILHGIGSKKLSSVPNMVTQWATSADGSFENVKMSFSGEQGATMRQLITAHMVRRNALCMIPVLSNNGSISNNQILVVAHDKGLLTCVDTNTVIKQIESACSDNSDSSVKKINIDRLAYNSVPMSVVNVVSNNQNPGCIAVAGIKDCLVVTLNHEYSISTQIGLNLALDSGNFIIKAVWIPGSQTQLAVVTSDFVKIYDLAVDVQKPVYYYHLLSGKLRDVTFLADTVNSLVHVFIMSSQGFIYTQVLDEQSKADDSGGPFYVTNTIVIESSELKMVNGQFGSGGTSVYYSHTMQTLFISFSNSKSFACSLKKLEELPTSTVLNKLQVITNSSSLCYWKEVEDHPGLILASDQNSGNVSVIFMCPDTFYVQEIALSPTRCKAIDAIAFVPNRGLGNKSPDMKCAKIALLTEDGSLKLFNVNFEIASFWFSPTFTSVPNTLSNTSSDRKKLKALTVKQKLSSKTASINDETIASGQNYQFPIDYFENCQVMEDVEFGGNDYLQVYNRKQMKNRLKHARQFLAATKSTPITMEITNENSSLLVAGLRVEVGGNQIGNADWTPRYFEIFGRSVPVEPTSTSRWVDLPFTNEECLKSEKNVILTIGNSRDTSSGITIVNSVKVYGKAKNSFTTCAPDSKARDSSNEEKKRGVDTDDILGVFGLRHAPEAFKSLSLQPAIASTEPNFDFFLSNSLEMLGSYFTLTNVEPKSKWAKEAREFARGLATRPLSPAVYTQNKTLLYSISQSKDKLYSELDEININCVARQFEAPNQSSIQPEVFEQNLETIKNIAQNRPKNLVRFSHFLTNVLVSKDQSSEGNTGERISTLVEDILTIFWSVVEDRCSVKLLVPLTNQTKVKNDKLVSSIVEILFAYGVQDTELMPQMMTHLVSLLLYHDAAISSVAKTSLIKLTRSSKSALKTAPLLKSTSAPNNATVATQKIQRQLTVSIQPSMGASTTQGSEAVGFSDLNEPTLAAAYQNTPEQVSAVSVQHPVAVAEHPLGAAEGFENVEAIPNDGNENNVPQNALDALLNAAPLLEIPNDADDEAMMELAIALSLQDQPGAAGNPPAQAIFGAPEPVDISIEDAEAQPVPPDEGGMPAELTPAVAVEPHVEFVETPDVSNLQGDSTDDTASVGETDDYDEEESIAATDGSALPGESLPATVGSGAASEDGNSLAGESIQTTASASSSAYGGEDGTYPASRSLVATPKALNVTGSTASIGGSAETGLNTSFLMEDSITTKLAESRVEMLKLMMTYFPQVCNVGGIRAIPFLQVFLSLSLELDDEKLIAEVLDHLLAQLKLKVDQNMFSRTFSKEVQVLLLRLLSMYMQKTKTEEISVLSKMTAQCLFENGVVSYCKEVVVEMLSFWQNSFNRVQSKESSKLLKPQSTRSAPDMHPFFLTNYVIEHQADVFEAYHQLVTEVSLRIPYQVYRILDVQSPLQIESIKAEWINTLSQYMLLPSQYVRHQVRKLLQFVCGTKEQYRLQRDLYVFMHQFDAIQSILFASCKSFFVDDEDQDDYEDSTGTVVSTMASGSEVAGSAGTGSEPSVISFPDNLTSLNYPIMISVVEHLKQVTETALYRCYSWFKFCEANPTVITFLMKLAPFSDDAIRQYIIELITLATCGAKTMQSIKVKSGVADRSKKSNNVTNATTQSGKDKNNTEDEANAVTPECNEKTCSEFVEKLVCEHVSETEWRSMFKIYFLESSTVPLRWQLHSLLCVFWKQISESNQLKLLDILWDLYDESPVFGKRASQLIDVLGYLTMSGKVSADRMRSYAIKMVEIMRHQNEALDNHPNFSLYEKLLKLVEFDGFYLESDACLVCHGKETAMSLIKLSSIKADSRFTTTTQIIKLISPHQIASIVCRISDINNSKMVKSMAIYYNKRTVASVVELKNNPQVWHRARKVSLEAGQSEVKIELALPVVATNIMMEVCDFYENVHAASEQQLQCPRCSSNVMANPGICGNCGENVFQCHKCRQINYDEKDPFLCSSCGFCKYAKFDFTLNAKACLSAIDPIENQDDRKKAIANLNTLLENADNLTRSIQTQKPHFEELLNRLHDREGSLDHLRSLENFPTIQSSNPTTPTGSMMAATSSNTFVHREIQAIAKKYYVSKMSFDELSVTAEKILATRAELFDYDQRNNLITVYSDAFNSGKKATGSLDDGKGGVSGVRFDKRCFGCLVHSSIHSLYLLRSFVTRKDVKTEVGKEILDTLLQGCNLGKVCERVQGLTNELISQVCRNDASLTNELCKALLRNINDMAHNANSVVNSSEIVSSRILHDQVALLVGNVDMNSDSCWTIRLRAVSQLLLNSFKSENPAIISHIVLPCMKMFLKIIQSDPKPTTTNAKKANVTGFDVIKFLSNESSYEEWKLKARSVEDVERVKKVEVKINETSWIKSTLFHPSSKAVRQTSCSILETLAAHSEGRCEAILVLLFAYIEESSCVNYGQDLTEVMALVQKLTSKDERKLFLSDQGIPKRIAELILCEIDRFADKERELGADGGVGGVGGVKMGSVRGGDSVRGGVSASWSHDLRQGVRLRCLTELLSGLLDVSDILNTWKAQLTQPILHGYLAIKKLVTQRTKAIDEAQEVLLEMLDLMTTGNAEETKDFMKICVSTLQQFPADDQLTPVFVFERLCNLIHPEVPDQTPDFSLCLEKDPQQEDFLAGRMQGNPYSCSEVGMGPLMRDVKNKICRDCELVALLEDDNGMELLVNNRIISLSLPVAEVYQKVWLAPERGGSQQNEMEPMRVVYRMRGLMGDATEEFIENLNVRSGNDSSGAEGGGEGQDDESKEEEMYKLASVLADCNGFLVMLNSLNSITDVFASRHLVYVLLKLFSFSVKVRSNRVALASSDCDTLNIFLRLLQLVLNMPESASLASSSMGRNSSKNEACTTRNELVEKVLLVMQPILQETQNSKTSAGSALKISGGDLTQLEQILSCMNISHIQQNPLLLQNLMTIVPYLAFGDNSSAKVDLLVGFFKPYIDFEKYNEDKLTNAQMASRTEMFVDCFTTMVESVPASDDGSQLKSAITKSGVLSACTNYILNLTPEKDYLSDQKAWKEFLARPAVPYVLKLMRALSMGHDETQLVIGESCIPVLHRLERVASEEQVGTLAENLLETLSENGRVSELIKGARKQTREEKKRLAMAMRAKQLETLGLEATGGGRMVKTSSHHAPNFDDLLDESGPVCCICREGYKYHPKSVMGIYVFAKKQPIEPFEVYIPSSAAAASGQARPGGVGGRSGGSGVPKSQGYTAVSPFTTVHFDCHNNAVRSHRGRDEWESATLQNGDVRCNAIMPMWGSKAISESQFAHSLSKYNTHLQECTGFREPNYQSTVHDCKMLLLKFCEEKSFSDDCGGGARNSNAKLIPFHLTIALYVMNTTRSATREEVLVKQYLQEPADKWVRNAFELEGVHFYAIMQVLAMKQDTYWNTNRLPFLRRLIACAHVRHFHPSGATFPLPQQSSQVATEYKVYKPALMYFTLIDTLVKLMAKQTIAPTNRGWSEDLFEYLKQNSNQFLEAIDKKLVSDFEEALAAESFDEWCDIVGLLSDIGPENVNNYIAETVKMLSSGT